MHNYLLHHDQSSSINSNETQQINKHLKQNPHDIFKEFIWYYFEFESIWKSVKFWNATILPHDSLSCDHFTKSLLGSCSLMCACRVFLAYKSFNPTVENKTIHSGVEMQPWNERTFRPPTTWEPCIHTGYSILQNYKVF